MKTVFLIGAIILLAFAPPSSHGEPPKNVPLDNKVGEILKNANVKPGMIPSGIVSLDDQNTYEVAYQWYLIQEPLEKMFQKELHLDYRPKLFLVVRETNEMGGMISRFRIVDHPAEPRIVGVLSRQLHIDKSLFDHELKLYGETSDSFIDEFKPEFTSQGVVDMARVQAAILKLLQSDIELTKEAKKLNGAFKPIRKPGDLVKASSMHVITEWQPLTGDNNRHIFWRATIALKFQAQGHFELTTLIELGEQLRTQSANQIRRFTDSNRLGAFDVVDVGREGAAVVRYKMVATSPAEKLLTPEDRKQFSELAPMLWNKVKITLHGPSK